MPRFACAAPIVVVKQSKEAATDVVRNKVKQFGNKQFGGPSKVSIFPNATRKVVCPVYFRLFLFFSFLVQGKV
jgi:hypothetical protein